MKLASVSTLLLFALVAGAQEKGNKGSRGLKGSKTGKGSGKGSGEESIRRDIVGALFTTSNSFPNELNGFDGRGNEIVMFHQFADADKFSEMRSGSFPTGGFGQGVPVVSFPIISEQNQIFATSLGSDELSAYYVDHFGAVRTDTVDTKGETPSSLAFHDKRRILYCLNGAFTEDGACGEGTPSLTAFKVTKEGKLLALKKFTRTFDKFEDLGAAQVSISPKRDFLFVGIQGAIGSDCPDIKNKGELLIFSLDKSGRPSDKPVSSISGIDFLFAFETAYFYKKLYVFVGSLVDASVASYKINKKGYPKLVTEGVVGPSQGLTAALCWLVRSGKYLYGTNFGTASISSWKIDEYDGSLQLLEEVAYQFPDIDLPTDAIVDDGVLYVNLISTGTIAALKIRKNGTLKNLEMNRVGIPSQVGLAAVNF